MRTSQGTMLQSLRAVDGFLTEHADKLGDLPSTGARKRLDDAIAALAGLANDQSGSALAEQGLTQKQHTLRETLLRDHMAKISRIAKADLPKTPEFQPLRMPRGRPTPEKLAAAANGMAQMAAQFPDVFTNAGMPADFLTQLTTAAASLVAAYSNRIQTRGKRHGATTGLRAKLSEARKVVHILDAFVSTALKNDPVLLADWKLVVRVPKSTTRARTAASSTGSSTPTTSTGTTTTSAVAAPAEPAPAADPSAVAAN